MEEGVGVSKKFFILFDDATNSMRIDGGFVFGEYPDREGALRAARMRGWKLPEPGVSRHPEPPTASAETAG
jgi:hypothetical protein